MRYALLICAFCCSSCTIFGRDTYVESRRPMIPEPARPVLVELPNDDQLDTMDAAALKTAFRAAMSNMEAVGTWGMKYESVVSKYNELAKAANIENGYVLADPEPTPTE